VPPDSPVGAQALALHFVEAADGSDISHVMWLNRNVTKHRITADELAPLLSRWASAADPLGDRVRR
jgi:hypothetical protein